MSSPKRIRSRTRALRRAINAMDYVASGTLLSRTKVCGRPNCRCAHDVAGRHGPCYEWTRRHDGRLLHSVVSADQAALFQQAIANHREIQRLLTQWERETAATILEGEASGDPQLRETIED